VSDHEDFGPGEIRRGFDRIERQLDAMQKDVSRRYEDLATKINAAIGPLSELRIRFEQQDRDLGKLAAKVRAVEKAQNRMDLKAAAVAGGATAIVFFVKFLLDKL
jgi:hypothetical protein